MLDRLPTYISPLDFAEKSKKVVGTVRLGVLKRLADLLVSDLGHVEIDLLFSRENKDLIVVGQIKTELVLQCQACLKPISQTVNQSFKLGLVNSLVQADRLPDDCEPLILEHGKILLTELIEDELLLVLPDHPRHQENCFNSSKLSEQNKTGTRAPSDNPFAVLAKLKNIGD